VIDSWLDRGFGWLISLGVHLALLLAMSLMVVERLVSSAGGDGLGLSCAFVARGLGVDRIDRPADDFGSKVKSSASLSLDDLNGQGSQCGILPLWTTIYVDEGEVWCGTCLRELRREVGCIRWVVLTRPEPVFEPLRGYAYRKKSLEENRTGMPRLRNRWAGVNLPYHVTSSLRHLRD
jgi:hypothetical protein